MVPHRYNKGVREYQKVLDYFLILDYYRDGLTYRKMGEMYGIHYTGIHKRIKNAIRRLKEGGKTIK
jgi:hypothetical protein